MELTVFGNNATCPEANGACACYLVETAGKKILLDMGNGSLGKLRKRTDLAELNIIVISHLHFDHFGDLFCAKYHLETRKAYGEDIPPIQLLTPTLPQWAETELCTNDVFEVHAITDGFRFEAGGVKLEFVEMVHLIESYGVRITAEGKTLAYSGDTGICKGLHAVSAEADAFLCEASFADGKAEEGHHLSAQTAAATARNAGISNLFLTHYHPGQAKMLMKSAKSIFPGAVLTKMEKTYHI